MPRVFIDTNILVYAVDRDAGQKREVAKEALAPFFQSPQRPVVSLQVIHEFAYRLFRWKVPADQIARLVEPMRYWQLVANDYDLYQLGMRLKQEFQLSFWDSLILAAAQRGGANELWSEGFDSGQLYGKVREVNPLIS